MSESERSAAIGTSTSRFDIFFAPAVEYMTDAAQRSILF